MNGFATYRAVTPTCDKFLVNAQSGSQTMARISKELTKRCDGKTNLAPRHVIVVRVASFAFRFETAERLRECIKYYEKKTRPPSRGKHDGLLGVPWLYPPFPASCAFRFTMTSSALPPRRPHRADLPQRVPQA